MLRSFQVKIIKSPKKVVSIEEFEKLCHSFVDPTEYIIYEDFISLFVQNNQIKTWELLEQIVELADKNPDSNSFLFANSSTILKRDLSLDIDNGNSLEAENSRLDNISHIKKSNVKMKSFEKHPKSPFRENINKSNIVRPFQYEEETVQGDNRLFLNIPKSNDKRFNKSLNKSSDFHLNTKHKSQFNMSNVEDKKIRIMTRSGYSNLQINQNKEDELVRKCILNLIKYSMEDNMDLSEQILKFSFDSKKISIGKFYFLVLHLLKINHHYSIDVLVN
jgi:hypothetical protein